MQKETNGSEEISEEIIVTQFPKLMNHRTKELIDPQTEFNTHNTH